jgi:hypothetical protein
VNFIASSIGRCIKLFSWEEIRPVHGMGPAMLAAAITERFGFQVRPTIPLPPDTKATFADGVTTVGDTVIAIQKFESYSDGFGVDCANTDDAGLVADELIKWAQTDLGFRVFSRPPKTIFLSQVVVEFSPEFENIFKSWNKLQSLMSGPVQRRYGFDQSVSVQRLQWRGDPHAIVNNALVSDFWIERKAGEPFSSNRWHCSGALPTEEWVELLGVLERLAVQGDAAQ